MNAERKAAQAVYDLALKNCRAAEMGTDEQAWKEADAKLSEARKNLVKVEMAYPTKQETKRRNERMYLHNIGIRD
jgi:hypothetical protein